MNVAAIQRDMRIGRTLAQFGAGAVLAHWDGSNESIRPLTDEERRQQWEARYNVFTHRFGDKRETA